MQILPFYSNILDIIYDVFEAGIVMIKLLTSAQMKLCDKYTMNSIPSRELMERAANACCDVLLKHFKFNDIVCVCGAGNNGGDGMAVAQIMKSRGFEVRVVFPSSESGCTEETAYRLARLREENITISDDLNVTETSVIVDALFGIGLSRNVEGKYAELIHDVNESHVPILSVDIPSGISADTGEIMGCAVHADRTVVIASMKPGYVVYPGARILRRIDGRRYRNF